MEKLDIDKMTYFGLPDKNVIPPRPQPTRCGER